MKFEWDPEKERLNIRKHAVTFEQAAYVFSDPCVLNQYDDQHSQEADRWVLLGKCLSEILLVVMHTYWHDDNSELVKINKDVR